MQALESTRYFELFKRLPSTVRVSPQNSKEGVILGRGATYGPATALFRLKDYNQTPLLYPILRNFSLIKYQDVTNLCTVGRNSLPERFNALDTSNWLPGSTPAGFLFPDGIAILRWKLGCLPAHL